MPDVPIRLTIIADASRANVAQAMDKVAGDLQSRADAATKKLSGRMDFLGIGGGLSAAGKALNGIGDAAVKIGATLYTAERIGRAIEGIAHRVKGMVGDLISSAETFRRFELSVSAARGVPGLSSGRAFDDLLIRRAGAQSGLGISQLQNSARQLAFGSGSGFGLLSDSAAVKASEDFARLVKRISIIAGDLDENETATNLRLLMDAADPRAARRLRVTPLELADSVGSTPAALRADPALTRRAIEKWSRDLIPDSVLSEWSGLVGERMKRLSGQWTRVLRDIAEGTGGGTGLYDRLASGLDSIEKSVVKFLNSPAWAQSSGAIGGNISSILDNAAKAALHFGAGVAGVKPGDDLAEGAASVVEGITRKLAEWTKGLPDLAEAAGKSLRGLGNTLSVFGDALDELASRVINNGVVKLASRISADNESDVVRLAQSRQNAAADVMAKLGISGVARTTYSTPSDARGFGWFSGEGIRELWSMATTGQSDLDKNKISAVNLSAVPANQAKQAAAILRAIEGMSGFTVSDQGRVLRALKAAGIDTDNIAPAASSAPARSEFATTAARYTDLFKSADRGGDFGAAGRLKGLGDKISELSDYSAESDHYTHAETLLKNGLSTLGGPDGLFAKGLKLLESVTLKFSEAISEFNSMAEGAMDEQSRRDAEGAIGELMRAQDKMRSAWTGTLDKLRNRVAEAYGRSAVAMIEGLSKDSPAARAAIMDGLIRGTGPEARAAATASGLPTGSFNFGTLPVEKQSDALAAIVKAQEELIGNAGRVGGLVKPGMSYAELTAMAQNPWSKRQVSSSLADYYQTSALPLAQTALTSAQNSNDPRAIANAASEVAELTAKLRAARIEASALASSWLEFGKAIEDGIQHGLADAIDRVISGTGNIRDVLVGFAHDVTKAFSEMSARNLMAAISPQSQANGGQGLFSYFLQGLLGSGTFGSFGGGALAGNYAGYTGAGTGGGTWATTAFADGGYVTGTKPVISLLGEAGPEVVTPLDRMHEVFRQPEYRPSHHAEGEGRTYIVVADEDEAFRRGLDRHRDHLVNLATGAVKRDFREGGPVHKTLRAKGL